MNVESNAYMPRTVKVHVRGYGNEEVRFTAEFAPFVLLLPVATLIFEYEGMTLHGSSMIFYSPPKEDGAVAVLTVTEPLLSDEQKSKRDQEQWNQRSQGRERLKVQGPTK